MKKIRLTEKDLQRIVKRVIKEYNDNEVGEYINEIAGGELKPDEKKRVIDSILDSSDDYTREELERLSLKDLLNAFKKYDVGMTKDWDKEDWGDDLGHRLIKVLEDYDHVLSNEEISDILMSVINSIDPIENYYDDKSGRWS